MGDSVNREVEQYLKMAEEAIANEDTEFALKLCRNAASFISDPRIILMIGKAMEAQGDQADAVCCFRAALTMDTGVNGSTPTRATVNEAKRSLQKVVKDIGLGGAWAGTDRKEAPVTSGKIEQLLRAGRVEMALQLYKNSNEFKQKKDLDFHLQVGKSLKETHSSLKEEAIQAFTVVTQCPGGMAPGCYEIGDCYYEAKEYDEATMWYDKALEAEPGMALALSGKANCCKDKGDLIKAVGLYLEAHEAAPKDPTFVFNLGQAYEYVQDYSSGVGCIDKFMGSISGSDMNTVNHFALPLLHLKLLFVGGPEYHGRLQTLIDQIKAYPAVAKHAVQKLATHWAYFFFLSHLLHSSNLSLETEGREALFFVGDSHVLSAAWVNMNIQGKQVYTVPKLVTGLKAWHLREGFEFLTVSNVHTCMASIPKGTKRAIFVCGEIDCREGLPNALAKHKYTNMQQAVEATLDRYLKGLEKLSEQYGIKFYLLSVCPPTNPEYTTRIQATKMFNDELKKRLSPLNRYLNIYDTVVSEQGIVRPEFNCDGTHMNRRILPLIEQEFNHALNADTP